MIPTIHCVQQRLIHKDVELKLQRGVRSETDLVYVGLVCSIGALRLIGGSKLVTCKLTSCYSDPTKNSLR